MEQILYTQTRMTVKATNRKTNATVINAKITNIMN